MNGVDCKLYVATGTHASPTLNEAGLVGDAQCNLKASEASGNVRDSKVELSEVTGFQVEVTGNIRVPAATNAAYDALDAAFFARSELDIIVLRGASTVTGVKGYRFPMKLFDWSEDQARGNVVYKSFSLKPCISDYKCQTVVVTSGAPVYTDL